MSGDLERWQSPRLRAERLGPRHFDEIHAMHRDERVMATLAGVRSEAQTREMLRNADRHWREHGFGYWLLRDRATDGFVGRGGLQRVEPDGRPDVEVGYALLAPFWGRGLAPEMVRACLGIAFERLRLESVVAFTLPTNRASRRVMEKSGFTFERDGTWKELPHVFYRIGRDAWRDGREAVTAWNRDAWNRRVDEHDRWTLPVSPEEVAAARAGDVRVVLTPVRRVPDAWLGPLAGADVLGLAASGGQQAPLFAAAGARVSVLDNSPRQLEQDRFVAEREGLSLRLELGRMSDLSRFDDASFDLVFHPVSNVFVPDVRPVWREVARVLRPGGRLLAGIANPANYLFDEAAEDRGELVVRHRLPYSDLEALTPEELEAKRRAGVPLEFSHSLEDQLGGQLEAGLVLTGLYEDGHPGRELDRWMPPFLATRAEKPAGRTQSS